MWRRNIFCLAGINDSKDIDTRIGDLVAAKFYLALTDLAKRFFLWKVLEIVLDLAAGELRDIGDRGRQTASSI